MFGPVYYGRVFKSVLTVRLGAECRHVPPHPDLLPPGEGTAAVPFSKARQQFKQHSAVVLPGRWESFSLAQRERAGVREKRDLPVMILKTRPDGLSLVPGIPCLISYLRVCLPGNFHWQDETETFFLCSETLTVSMQSADSPRLRVPGW